MATSRREKERALAALLEGNAAPLVKLKRDNLPMIYLQAEEEQDGTLRNVLVEMWTTPKQRLEQYDQMSREDFEKLRKRMSRKALPWVEIRMST